MGLATAIALYRVPIAILPLVPEREFVPTVNILLADDNAAVLDHVREMLEKDKSYAVIAAVADGP
jgi:hypothetical protein